MLGCECTKVAWSEFGGRIVFIGTFGLLHCNMHDCKVTPFCKTKAKNIVLKTHQPLHENEKIPAQKNKPSRFNASCSFYQLVLQTAASITHTYSHILQTHKQKLVKLLRGTQWQKIEFWAKTKNNFKKISVSIKL